MEISCVTEPEEDELSLIDAYVYGCPAPFVAYLQIQAGIRHRPDYRTLLI